MYKLTNSAMIIRLLDGAIIPADERNSDYRDYLAWIAAGNAPQPFTSTTPDKNTLKSNFTDWLNSIMEQITGPVPDDEKNVWPVKEAAAKAVLAGTADATQTAILSAEATITGETIAALSTRILQKATIYRGVVARMAGLRRATEVALDAAIPSQYQDIINKAKAQAPLLVRDAGATI